MSTTPSTQLLQLLVHTDRELRMTSATATHQHYRGGLYQLLGVTRDADTGLVMMHSSGADQLLLYEHLWPCAHSYWLRTWDEFHGSVATPEWHPAAGSLERVRRFRPIGQGWEV